MPVMGMMFLGLEPSGSETQTGSSGEITVDEDEAVAMIVSTSCSPDVLVTFRVKDSGEFLLPAGTSQYFPFAKSFSWRTTDESDTTVGAVWMGITNNGYLKRRLGL